LRARSETWKKLALHGHFAFDTKARIEGKDYFRISAPVIDRPLMSSPLSVGACNAATLSLSVLTDDEIPSGGQVVILGRLTDGETVTEWKPFGTFYIDQRDTSYAGLVALSCYDGMLKAKQDYLAEDDLPVNWPRSMKDVVEEIAFRMGVGIDPRTRICTGPDYIVPFPEGKTMEQVLGYIGACHGGNWIITEENLLRLVPLTTAPDETFHIIDEDYHTILTGDGYRLAYKDQEAFHAVLPPPAGELPDSQVHRTFYIIDDLGHRIVTPEGYFLIYDTETESVIVAEESALNIPVVCGNITTGPTLTVSRVTMAAEGGETFTAGDDTGYTLDIGSNPYATQGICNDLLTAYQGLVYLPYTATKTLYDPAAELGDQIKIGGMVHSVLYNVRAKLDHNFRADIDAPNSAELSTEYPYLSQRKRLDGLAVEVKKNGQAVEKVSSELKVTNDSITAEVKRAKEQEKKISEDVSTLQIYVGGITLSVRNNGTSSTIELKAGEATIASQTIRFTGVVTFSDLSTPGWTTIVGDNITTGTIDAQKVTLGNDYGGFKVGTGYNGKDTTVGAMMYGSDPEYYFFASNGGVRMTAAGTHLFCADGLIKASTAISEGSDRNLKNAINHDLDRYRALFMALQPAFYKFNDGTSDRFHTGFIAQEVEDAIKEADLTTKDFAGLVIDTHENPERHCEQVTEYGLRYSEFVSLNTYMIQQAFGEIENMKKEIAALKAEIKALKEGK